MLQGLNVYLVGMMGVGKSTVGQLLAKELGYSYVDTDQLIVSATKQEITEIFATVGEDEFRQLETQVLEQVASYTKLVIATGGGIVLNRYNWSHLRQGLVIWLEASVEVLFARLINDDTRPLLKTGDLRERLIKLSTEREGLYSQADLRITIDISDSPEEIVNRIIDAIPTVLTADLNKKLAEIPYFYQVTKAIATSGQPDLEQFAIIKNSGYEVVINLSADPVAHQGEIISKLGMIYHHLPVNWENPTLTDWDNFIELMNRHKNQRLFIHCVANKRVAVFVYLYRVLYQQIPLAIALRDLHQVWIPNEIWQSFIDRLIIE